MKISPPSVAGKNLTALLLKSELHTESKVIRPFSAVSFGSSAKCEVSATRGETGNKVLHRGKTSSFPGGRAVEGVSLLPLAGWDCGFESSRGYGCQSLVTFVCCQVQGFAMCRSLVQRSPTECVCASKCDQVHQ